MNLNENGRLVERAHKTIQKRFCKINITKYFRICGCSEILTDEKIQRVLWEHERGLKLGENKTTIFQFVLYSS